MRMKPKIKKLWTAALRSGEVEQGRGTLRDKYNKMCCFGLLCNLHAQAHPEIAARQLHRTKYMGQVGYPPPEVVEWAGLRSIDPYVLLNGSKITLTALNDDVGLNFRQIADVIDKQL